MGDIAVDIFQETLKELITNSNLSLIIEEKHQLQSLEDEIKYLRGFLKVTEKKRNNSEVMELVMQIKDLVSEAENTVELFVVHASKVDHAPYSPHDQGRTREGARGVFGPCTPPDFLHIFSILVDFFVKLMKNGPCKLGEICNPASTTARDDNDHLSLDLETIKNRMKTLTAEVKKIHDENMYEINGAVLKQLKHFSTGSGGSSRGSHTSKVAKEKVVVGFDEEVEKLIAKLAGGEDKPLEIISIIGAGGGGKTTLAREVYDHRFTLHTFDIRAWIDISQDYGKTRKRDLLIRILESVKPKKQEDYEEHSLKKHEDYEEYSDDKLGEDILKCLKRRKYLIVMDDIWGVEAWNDIHKSFPTESKGSKVLFTSRLDKLDSVSYVPHYLAPLPKNWCWELLRIEVFGMNCCPPELVDIGEKIAEKCGGLPLAVVTIAGHLATEDKTLKVWEKVAKHLSSIIAENDKRCMEILEFSYNHLPLHLKACFLYIGGYPEDNEIHVRELIWLWIAEGFIQGSEGGESLETIAKGYLTGLIERSLVQVARKRTVGGIKTCRVHDLLREFCLKKAEFDNFHVSVYKNDSLSPSATKEHRRLFIGHQFVQKFSSRPQNLRSFLCLSSLNKYQSQVETKLSFFAENFELLRVLSFISGTCHGEIGTGLLVHLRYLAFKFDWYGLPFSYLLNLETLNHLSPFSNDTIQLPRYIFKMVKLRHLYTKNGVFTFHFFEEAAERNDFYHSSSLDSLQTLHRICACEACRSFLLMTPNLRKLGLHGEDNNVLRLLNLEFLKCLETLTFTSDQASDSSMESTLLPGLKLPLTIRRITFKYTSLKWEELSLLQTLPSLEVLRLIDYACAGPVWNTTELEGYPQLKYLMFSVLDIEEWKAFEDQFPKLEVLALESCRKLELIPVDFGNLNELREIKLEDCRSSAEESAREIQKEQRNRNGDDDCLNLLAKNNVWGLRAVG